MPIPPSPPCSRGEEISAKPGALRKPGEREVWKTGAGSDGFSGKLCSESVKFDDVISPLPRLALSEPENVPPTRRSTEYAKKSTHPESELLSRALSLSLST